MELQSFIVKQAIGIKKMNEDKKEQQTSES